MTVLVTGAAGFIGSAVSLALLARGDTVVGVDNHNDYYDPALKEARIQRQLANKQYTHVRLDLADRTGTKDLFGRYQPKKVVHLAAQAGVRYSIENPQAYIDSNIVAFGNILEGCRQHQTEHLVYASSSSVYGANTTLPYSTRQNVDHPLSLYAATKKSNELMAHAYSHLYQLPTTGLRFFTVYGPWGRPDMALFKFTDAILSDKPIQVFNYGNHKRDFTYIDDIVDGVIKVLDRPPVVGQCKSTTHQPDASQLEGHQRDNSEQIGQSAIAKSDKESPNTDPTVSEAPWRIYNIGNNQPVPLLDCISILENALNKKATLEFLPMQPGDVLETFADIDDLNKDFGFRPSTQFTEGARQFVAWYLTLQPAFRLT